MGLLGYNSVVFTLVPNVKNMQSKILFFEPAFGYTTGYLPPHPPTRPRMCTIDKKQHTVLSLFSLQQPVCLGIF